MEYWFGIFILEHWNLFEIWFLVLGILLIFIKQVYFENLILKLI